MSQSRVKDRLKKDEGNGPPGKAFQLYPDSLGFLTLGYGFLVDPRKGATIPEEIAEDWLDFLIYQKGRILEDQPWWHGVDEVRQDILECLFYNINFLTKFPNMVKALEVGNYEEAADQLEFTDSTKQVYSAWYHEVKDRAPVYVRILRTGVWE